MQLCLLAQLCSVCEISEDASPKASEAPKTAATKSNAESVEALLAALRSAEQLPGLLLGLVKGFVQQLQHADGKATPGQLPEALSGEAPGCGELLKPCKPVQKLAW